MTTSVSDGERLARVESEVSHVRSDVNLMRSDLTTIRNSMVQLVDITARLDERFPQPPSKRQLASLGTIATVASVVISTLLQQFGITKG